MRRLVPNTARTLNRSVVVGLSFIWDISDSTPFQNRQTSPSVERTDHAPNCHFSTATLEYEKDYFATCRSPSIPESEVIDRPKTAKCLTCKLKIAVVIRVIPTLKVETVRHSTDHSSAVPSELGLPVDDFPPSPISNTWLARGPARYDLDWPPHFRVQRELAKSGPNDDET